MPLTHFDLKNAPRRKTYKQWPAYRRQAEQQQLWRLKYHFHGNERRLSFGSYPLVSLAEAREKRDEAMKLISTSTDPSVKRKRDRIAAQMAASSR